MFLFVCDGRYLAMFKNYRKEPVLGEVENMRERGFLGGQEGWLLRQAKATCGSEQGRWIGWVCA